MKNQMIPNNCHIRKPHLHNQPKKEARKGDANPLENCSQLKTRGEKVAKQACVGHEKREEAAKCDKANPAVHPYH